MGMLPEPVELTPKQRRKQNVYKFFSPLCGREVELESFVEFIVWLSLEFSPDTEFLCERPGILVARVNGKDESYTPDLFVRTQSKEEFLGESKKDEDLVETPGGERLPKRWAVMSGIAAHYNLPLRLFTDADFLDRRVAVGNWREVLPHVAGEAQRPRHPLRKIVLDQFDVAPQLTLGELSASIADWSPSEVHGVALWWVHQGSLVLDWNAAPLGRQTLLTRTIPQEVAA